MKALDYRPDLDGLRGFGALIVIMFHVGFSEPSGGFVAIDMFFVISGFLITRLIRHEFVQTGTFSYGNFYLRRARRLMPALFFTLALSFAVGAIVFAPGDLERFGGAVVHAVASLSNFYFWSEAGYFDAESSLKPLLHTWSLGVEEQFYLLWPLSLIFLLAKAPRLTVPTVFVVGAASLVLNVIFKDGEVSFLEWLWPPSGKWIEDGHSTIYFLTPFRVFEFAIGSLAVWWHERPAPGRVAKEALALAGLAGLVVPMFVYTEETLFPSYYALPPCLGTALLIYTRNAWTNRMLGSRILVGLGLASYSIYLAHQPIMAFYRYVQGALTSPERWALSVASVGAGLLMYRFIELPFRRGVPEERWSPGGFGFGCMTFALVLMLVSANPWATNGWPWRYGETPAIQGFLSVDQQRREREIAIVANNTTMFEPADVKILIVGDSLSDDLLVAMAENLDDSYHVSKHAYRPRCGPLLTGEAPTGDRQCTENVDMLHRSLKIPLADQIWISFMHRLPHDPTEVRALVTYLKRRSRQGARYVVFGRGPEFPRFRPVAISMLANGESIARVEERARQATLDVAELDRGLAVTAGELGLEFVPRSDLFCDATRCRFFSDDGAPIFWDSLHLTVDGARWYGAQIGAHFNRVAEGGGAPATPAEPIAPRPAAAARQAESPPDTQIAELSEPEAWEIHVDFSRLVRTLPLNGINLYDTSRLPRSKELVEAAFRLLLSSAPKGSKDRRVVQYSLKVLAFFQPGVGQGATMDSIGPDGEPWRTKVVAEMLRVTQRSSSRFPRRLGLRK